MSEQPCWLITTKYGGEFVTITHKGSLFDFLRDYDTPILWAQKISINIINTTQITAGIVLNNYAELWGSIKVKILESDGGLYTKRLSELTTNPSGLTITLNNVKADPYATILQFFTM